MKPACPPAVPAAVQADIRHLPSRRMASESNHRRDFVIKLLRPAASRAAANLENFSAHGEPSRFKVLRAAKVRLPAMAKAGKALEASQVRDPPGNRSSRKQPEQSWR